MDKVIISSKDNIFLVYPKLFIVFFQYSHQMSFTYAQTSKASNKRLPSGAESACPSRWCAVTCPPNWNGNALLDVVSKPLPDWFY